MNKDKIKDVFIVAMIFIPVIVVAGLIYKYAVNVPYWDQWRTANFLIQYYEGRLNISDFFMQHNEHRIFFPTLANFIIALATHFNTNYELYFSLLLIIGILLTLYMAFRKLFQKNCLVYFIPVVWILFTLRQYTNFLWGFEDCVYLCILGMVASLYFLIFDRGYKGILLAIISGVVASYSFFSGLLIWPVGFCALLIARRKMPEYVAWALGTFFTLVLFFWGWTRPTENPSLINFTSVSDLMAYFFILIGSPLAGDLVSAASIGLMTILLLACTAYLVLKNRAAPTYNYFICLLLLSVGFSVLNALGRSGWGLYYAFMSRYVPFTLLAPIAAYAILLGILISPLKSDKKPLHILFGGFLGLMLIGLMIGNVQGYQQMVSENPQGFANDNLVYDQYYLLSYQYQTDDHLKLIHPQPAYLHWIIPQAEKYQMSVFYGRISPGSLPLSNKTTYASIDAINGSQFVNNSTIILRNDTGSIQIGGWAFDAPDNAMASAVFIALDDKYDIPTIYGLERPDVADYFKDQGLKDTGYWATFNASFLEPGTHKLQLKIISHDKKRMVRVTRVYYKC